MATSTGKGLRLDIQALRAVAVLVVIAYHYGFGGFKGGFLGVDIFFVISGFVITNRLSGYQGSFPASPLERIIAAPSLMRRSASPRFVAPQTKGTVKFHLSMWFS